MAFALSKGVNFYSVAREIELGRQASAGLERLDAYAAQPGSDLARRAGSQFAYAFVFYDRKRVVAQPVAMAMPADAFAGEQGEAVAVAGFECRPLPTVPLRGRTSSQFPGADALGVEVLYAVVRERSTGNLVEHIKMPAAAARE